MNYLEHYRSAYIIYICLYHQKSSVSLADWNLQLNITVLPWYRYIYELFRALFCLYHITKEAGWPPFTFDLSTSPYHVGT